MFSEDEVSFRNPFKVTTGGQPVETLETAAPVRISETLGRLAPANPLRRLSPSAAASEVLTDFERERPFVVAPDRHVDLALHDMVVQGVRALLVLDEAAVAGLLTAADILGPRPVQFLQNPTCRATPCRHADVFVRDIMTAWSELQTVDMGWIETHTCADVEQAFGRTDVSHLVVTQRFDTGTSVRGLLSRSRLARQVQ